MNHSSNSSAVLVVGATGHLGSEICKQLVSQNKRVRGLVRNSSDPEKVNYLKELGVETVLGDLKDKASLIDAAQGVSAIISTATAIISRQSGDSLETVDADGQLNLVDAAMAAGVEHFVFISFNPMPLEFPLQTAKRKVEKRLAETGLAYTILQPTCFMEVWLGPAVGFDHFKAKATIYGEGNNRLSWISANDVARIAVASVDNPGARNKIFELGGPEPLSPLEVVKIFESSQGRKFEIQMVPEEALRSQKETAQDPVSESFAALMLIVAGGSEIDMKDTLNVFPMQLVSVNEYASSFVAPVA